MKSIYGRKKIMAVCAIVASSLFFWACDDSSTGPSGGNDVPSEALVSSSSEEVLSSSEQIQSSSGEKVSSSSEQAKSSSSAKVSSSSKQTKSSSSEKTPSPSELAKSSSSRKVSSSSEQVSSSSEVSSSSDDNGNACTLLLPNVLYQHEDVLSGKPFVCETDGPRVATYSDTLKLDTIGICNDRRGDGFTSGIYTETKYVCESNVARNATQEEIDFGAVCTKEMAKTGVISQDKACYAQGKWRDITESEKIVGEVCKTVTSMIFGSRWSCDGNGNWTVLSNLGRTSIGKIGASTYVGTFVARGTQLWVTGRSSMVSNFSDAKKYCRDLAWHLNDSLSAGFHLATESDWQQLMDFNDYAKENGDGDSTNLYLYYLRAENFYDESASAGNENCDDTTLNGPDKRCASPTWVQVWTDDLSRGVTYTVYNTKEIIASAPVIRSHDGYQQDPTTKLPFFCVHDDYRK